MNKETNESNDSGSHNNVKLKTKILLVEDEPAHAEIIRRKFIKHKNEFELVIADTIKDAKKSVPILKDDIFLIFFSRLFCF